jgi:hypothetical protein
MSRLIVATTKDFSSLPNSPYFFGDSQVVDPVNQSLLSFLLVLVQTIAEILLAGRLAIINLMFIPFGSCEVIATYNFHF